MEKEVRITDYDFSGTGSGGGGEDDDGRVSEWEDGLPDVDDLMPLTQSLVSSELLSAFNIRPEPYRSTIDLNHAFQNTISNLRSDSEQQSFTRFDNSTSFSHNKVYETVVEGEQTADLSPGGSNYRKLQRIGNGGGAIEETESDLQTEDPSARVSKRPRLVWTPQLHKRFIEVVAHLGVTNAVPKTIMQLMNVEGLSRENVASHLQKYRLYLKRMQSLPTRGSSSSTPASQNSHESGAGNEYRPPPAPIAVPYYMPYSSSNQMNSNSGFNSDSYPYHMTMQQRNWNGNRFDSVSGYDHGMNSNN